jgi:hypothetical protein
MGIATRSNLIYGGFVARQAASYVGQGAISHSPPCLLLRRPVHLWRKGVRVWEIMVDGRCHLAHRFVS